jgi:hypothetical protein
MIAISHYGNGAWLDIAVSQYRNTGRLHERIIALAQYRNIALSQYRNIVTSQHSASATSPS